MQLDANFLYLPKTVLNKLVQYSLVVFMNLVSLPSPRFFFPGPAVGRGDGAQQLGVNFDAAPCLQNLESGTFR